MSQAFKRDYLQHALAISRWVQDNGAQSGIDPCTQALDLRLHGRTVRLIPQFIVQDQEGRFMYTPQMSPAMCGFVGWLPYFNKVWSVAEDKLAFKQHAALTGIRTPRWTVEPAQAKGAFIVKSRRSTFGRGLRGPFDGASLVALEDGEYCEQFIVGRLLKALFWNDQLVALELLDMPAVRGDGKHTMRQLIGARLAPTERFPEDLAPLVAIQGLELDSVVPEGRVALADYRYVSPLHFATGTDFDVRSSIAGSPLETQVIEAGQRCLRAVPPEKRFGTAFSLDGVVDSQGQIWFLEVNCNPQLHPALYRTMLSDIFAAFAGTTPVAEHVA